VHWSHCSLSLAAVVSSVAREAGVCVRVGVRSSVYTCVVMSCRLRNVFGVDHDQKRIQQQQATRFVRWSASTFRANISNIACKTKARCKIRFGGSHYRRSGGGSLGNIILEELTWRVEWVLALLSGWSRRYCSIRVVSFILLSTTSVDGR
jgi:hypothetical protein